MKGSILQDYGDDLVMYSIIYCNTCITVFVTPFSLILKTNYGYIEYFIQLFFSEQAVVIRKELLYWNWLCLALPLTTLCCIDKFLNLTEFQMTHIQNDNINLEKLYKN